MAGQFAVEGSGKPNAPKPLSRGLARFPGRRFKFATLSDFDFGIFPDVVLCEFCLSSTASGYCGALLPLVRAPLGCFGHLSGTYEALLTSFDKLMGSFSRF